MPHINGAFLFVSKVFPDLYQFIRTISHPENTSDFQSRRSPAGMAAPFQRARTKSESRWCSSFGRGLKIV